MDLVLRCGARVADPGEFTRRAFLNGRIDLTQAESVLDIIRARTDLSLLVAQGQRSGLLGHRIDAIKAPLVEALAYLEATLDFPEEEVGEVAENHIRSAVRGAAEAVAVLLSTFNEGRIIHDGVTVMIAGVPNVGKSSLMNALLDEERAIVTPIPGTTRDIIEDTLVIDGVSVRLLDTAGLRHTLDPVEQVGVRFVRDRLVTADLVLLVLDASRPMETEELDLVRELAGHQLLVVANKSDLPPLISLPPELRARRLVSISARTGVGLAALKQAIHDFFVTTPAGACRETLFLTNRRHVDLVRRASESLERFLDVSERGLPPEIAALELRLAVDSLGEITGAVTTDELLDVIFGAFCVGK
jgi:tRNA modification GTPase